MPAGSIPAGVTGPGDGPGTGLIRATRPLRGSRFGNPDSGGVRDIPRGGNSPSGPVSTGWIGRQGLGNHGPGGQVNPAPRTVRSPVYNPSPSRNRKRQSVRLLFIFKLLRKKLVGGHPATPGRTDPVVQTLAGCWSTARVPRGSCVRELPGARVRPGPCAMRPAGFRNREHGLRGLAVIPAPACRGTPGARKPRPCDVVPAGMENRP